MIPVLIGRVFLVPEQMLTPTQLSDFSGASTTLAGTSASFLGILAWGALSFVFGLLSSAATVVIVSDSYLGREVTVGAAINRVFERLWVLVGAVLLQLVLVCLGVIVFIIGSLIAACWFFATTNVVMVEGKGVQASLARSRELARGSIGKILGTISLAGLLIWLVELLVGVIVLAIVSKVHVGPLALNLGPYVLGIFVAPFINVVITLLYYDLRIRKEGFDLELMAKELGFAAA
jgi:hypothetical protein